MQQTLTTEWTTPGGKVLKVARVRNTGMLKFVWRDGGVIPPELSGYWTNTKLMNDAATRYLAKLPEPIKPRYSKSEKYPHRQAPKDEEAQ